jgi:hypothetical protein
MEINNQQMQEQNPLSKHFRQPSIYFKLPSNGSYWNSNSLHLNATGEVGVMPMTTKDEITLKTPDALLNGQGVVSVIQSCCPQIQNAWDMPSTDVDATLVAIRIASYGNQMDFTSKCPHCETESDYAIDLGVTLSSISAADYTQPITIGDLQIKLKPQNYQELNRANMIAFEEQQILRSIGELEGDPQGAQERFDQHLEKVIQLNINLLASSTESITTQDGTIVTNLGHIAEFFDNAENKVIKQVQKEITRLNEAGGIKPVTVSCNGEECNKEFPVNITFDYASFFA